MGNGYVTINIHNNIENGDYLVMSLFLCTDDIFRAKSVYFELFITGSSNHYYIYTFIVIFRFYFI